MSYELVDLATYVPIEPADRLVLILLARYANDEARFAWPSVGSLAIECGMEVRSIQRILRRLESGGWITIKSHHREGGLSDSNRYHFNAEMLTAAMAMTKAKLKSRHKKTTPGMAESASVSIEDDASSSIETVPRWG